MRSEGDRARGRLTSGRLPLVVLFRAGVGRRALPHRALPAPRHLLCHPSISCCLCWLRAVFLLSQLVPPSTPRFMEFEEEDMQNQKLQWMKGAQGLPPPAPPRPDPSELSAPMVASQPGRVPSSRFQRQQGLRKGHSPHIGLFIQWDIGLATRTAMGTRVSGAL